MDLTRLTDHPELLDKETLFELRRLTALYPYYQPARLLMLQNLYLLHDSSFEEEMKRAAIYITNRKTLFDMVESAHYRLHPDTTEPAPAPQTSGTDRTLDLIDGFLDSEAAETTAPAAPVRRKPTPTDATVDYTAYLMSLDTPEPDTPKEDTPNSTGKTSSTTSSTTPAERYSSRKIPNIPPNCPRTPQRAQKTTTKATSPRLWPAFTSNRADIPRHWK